MISCILLAAGAGKRMQSKANKMFLQLGPYSVLQWNLIHMSEGSGIDEIIIVVAAGEEEQVKAQYETVKTRASQPVKIVLGGKERQDSVMRGTEAVAETAQIILVHDGARPMAKGALFKAVSEKALEVGAAVAAVPSVDTIKQVAPEGLVEATLPRQTLYAVQTPQGFRRDVLLGAQAYAKDTGFFRD